MNAMPVMRNPLRSSSLAEFWGRRWNTAFHELAPDSRSVPCGPLSAWPAPRCSSFWYRAGSRTGDLVPARGGYGLPTDISCSKDSASPSSARDSAGGSVSDVAGAAGCSRLVAAGPAFWLFPPPFVRNVILPMLAAIGAT